MNIKKGVTKKEQEDMKKKVCRGLWLICKCCVHVYQC